MCVLFFFINNSRQAKHSNWRNCQHIKQLCPLQDRVWQWQQRFVTVTTMYLQNDMDFNYDADDRQRGMSVPWATKEYLMQHETQQPTHNSTPSIQHYSAHTTPHPPHSSTSANHRYTRHTTPHSLQHNVALNATSVYLYAIGPWSEFVVSPTSTSF